MFEKKNIFNKHDFNDKKRKFKLNVLRSYTWYFNKKKEERKKEFFKSGKKYKTIVSTFFVVKRATNIINKSSETYTQ